MTCLLSSRVRVLPPLDERVYRSLVRQVVAVLDPFPVGMSVPILEALMDGVPVVSVIQRTNRYDHLATTGTTNQ